MTNSVPTGGARVVGAMTAMLRTRAGIAITTAGTTAGIAIATPGTTAAIAMAGTVASMKAGREAGTTAGTVIVATIVARRIRSLATVRTTGATTAGISRRPATRRRPAVHSRAMARITGVTAGISRRPAARRRPRPRTALS